jgi:hypothetical protein
MGYLPPVCHINTTPPPTFINRSLMWNFMYDSLPRITFLNGPAQVGKDTLANLICTDKRFMHVKMSRRLKDALRPFLFNQHADFDSDAFKRSDLHGTSVRKALISLSEDWAKPTFGLDIFGRLLASDIEALLTENPELKFVVSDSRFEDECRPVLKICGKGLLVRIHRPGHDFTNDSGSYLNLDIKSLDVHNNAQPEAMLRYLCP